MEALVKRVKNNNAIVRDFIMNKHYAKRLPSISFAYHLILDDLIVGIVTYGKPASNSLCEGVCGKEYKSNVFELNRLITINNLPKNSLSKLTSMTLRDLPKDLVIVSYSDMGMSHNGYIYQALSFIYTGETKARTDKYTVNGKHSRHYNDKFNHLRKYRTPKHRYVFFTGKRKKWIKRLKYPIYQYPKGDNNNYVLGERQKQKILDKDTGNIFYE